MAAIRATDLGISASHGERPRLELLQRQGDSAIGFQDALDRARRKGDTEDLFTLVRESRGAATSVVNSSNNDLFIKGTHGISIADAVARTGAGEVEVLLKEIAARDMPINWPVANEIALRGERNMRRIIEGRRGVLGANATVHLGGAGYFRISVADIGYWMWPHLREAITDEHFGFGRRAPNVIPEELLR